jgi:hypothetical protein
MIEPMINAVLIALLQGKNPLPLLSNIMMIPIYITTIVYVTMIFLKIFNVKIVNKLEKFMPIILFLPIISIIYLGVKYHPYILSVIGVVLFVVGVVLIKYVVSHNQGKMPMFPSLSYSTKMINKCLANNDNRHKLGDENTKFIPLCDIFDFGYNIFSLGDFCLFSIFGLIIYGCIK